MRKTMIFWTVGLNMLIDVIDTNSFLVDDARFPTTPTPVTSDKP